MPNVIEYCVPGKLIDLEVELINDCHLLYYGLRWSSDYGRLDKVRPILHRLERLSFINYYNQMEPKFLIFRRDLPNLTCLELKWFHFYEDSPNAFPNEMSNVAEFRLINVHLNDFVHDLVLHDQKRSPIVCTNTFPNSRDLAAT